MAGGFIMTGEDFDSFTLNEKQSLGLVPAAPEVNRFQAVGAISSLPDSAPEMTIGDALSSLGWRFGDVSGLLRYDSETNVWTEQKIPAIPPVWESAVTPEIVSAGRSVVHQAIEEFRALGPQWDVGSEDYWAIQIYRAMHAVAPVELVPEGERIAVRERDEALARVLELQWTGDAAEAIRKMQDLLTWAEDERQGLNRQLAAAYLERDERDVTILAKDQRIAELDSELARRPAAKVGESKAPNPFREHRTEPRRMGPLA